jgi:hypothetical protein
MWRRRSARDDVGCFGVLYEFVVSKCIDTRSLLLLVKVREQLYIEAYMVLLLSLLLSDVLVIF